MSLNSPRADFTAKLCFNFNYHYQEELLFKLLKANFRIIFLYDTFSEVFCISGFVQLQILAVHDIIICSFINIRQLWPFF